MAYRRQLESPEGQRLLAMLRGVAARLPEVEETAGGIVAPKRLARLVPGEA